MSDRNVRGRIALGVTGGIAAYKTAELARLLVRANYEVWPIMTPWAAKFLGPLTLEALTGHTVRVETPSAGDVGGIEHISLIRQADLLLIAPLTANTMAKMAQGLADNFLTTTYLAHKGATMVCPAMNTAMLDHPATMRNLTLLESDGVFILPGEAGELACGETGAGRMAEPDVILDAVHMLTAAKLDALDGRRVLITAGPTREDLDPVRYLTNRSSGKMGLAVARAFRDAGADVTLVHGPIQERIPGFIEAVPIVSADEMAASVLAYSNSADIVVMAAAVADYKPKTSAQKLKKDDFDGHLTLTRTTDILAALGERRKKGGPMLVGFAAETENVLENARGKLERKHLDLLFANDVSHPNWGFGGDHNRLWAVGRDGRIDDLGEHTKDELGRQIVLRIAETFT